VAKRVSLKGKGADLFFGDYPVPSPPASTDEAGEPVPEDDGLEPIVSPFPAGSSGNPTPVAPEPVSPPRTRTRRRADDQSPLASLPAGKQDEQLASTLASNGAGDVEAIRRVVKAPGREVSFVRLTPVEKEELAEVVYTFKRRGVKTTENEINRIAINALLADYRTNGERSTLARVLAALQA